MTAAVHTCHAEGCQAEVPPRWLMCPRHWAMVPAELRRLVWRTYRRGQEIDKRPSAAYLAAAKMAIRAVAGADPGLRAAARRPAPRQGLLL